ncbi:MAG: TIGR01777 family oxidoreductase, partial [Ferruginibacter sp.]
DWVKELEAADMLINLTGKTVNCRYTDKNKKVILNSRINAVKVLGLAFQQLVHPPKLWINAGSATIYRNALDRPQDEYTGEIENDFSVQVCKLWEKTFYDQRTPFTRKIELRMAVTIGDAGVMIPYFNLLKFKLGGRQGSGKQMYSWIHINDTCRMIDWIYTHENIEGTYNCCSPFPVTNNDFMKTLRKVTGHRIGLPAYKWMLEIGTRLIGSETELLLKSRWVVPTKIMETGFNFQYPLLKDAFEEIVSGTARKKYHLL